MAVCHGADGNLGEFNADVPGGGRRGCGDGAQRAPLLLILNNS